MGRVANKHNKIQQTVSGKYTQNAHSQHTPRQAPDTVSQLQRTMGNQVFQQFSRIDSAALSDGTQSFKNRMASAFGINTADVPIHTNSPSARDMNVHAYTDGRSIHFRQGITLANYSDQARLAHEYAHIAQQRRGLVEPTGRLGQQDINTQSDLETQATHWAQWALQGEAPFDLATETSARRASSPIIQGEDLYTVAIHHEAFIHHTHDIPAPSLITDMPEPPRVRLKFRVGTEVALLNTFGNWLEVHGDAFDEYGRPQGMQRGWILRSQTNLAPAADAATENDRIAQDLDDFLDQLLVPTLNRWKAAIRVQGNAYLTAYTNFDGAINEANEQRKTEADFFAAVLTTVCVGGFGYFGDIVQTGTRFQNLFGVSEEMGAGLGGSIEDAIQTGIGEAIDIRQGGWYQRQANTEMHPDRYRSIHLQEMDHLIADSQERVGDTKGRIRRSPTAADRAQVLVELYNWWNRSIVKDAPAAAETGESAMAQELEKGFWINYMFEWAVRQRDFGEFGGEGHHYEYLPRSFEAAFDRLGMREAASIREWNRGLFGTTMPHLGTGSYPTYRHEPAWEGSEHGETREIPGQTQAYAGPTSTRLLIAWMRGYRLRTFE